MILRSSLRAVACIAAACGTSFAAHAAPSYHLVDLGANSGASAINDHGVVAGGSGSVGGVWRDGVFQPRARSTGLNDIDDQGEAIGGATIGPDGNEVPAYWPHAGAPVEIDSPFTPKRTVPIAVASGRVAGYSYGTTGPYHCFEWTPRHVRFLVDDAEVGVVEQSPGYPMQFMLGLYERSREAPAGPRPPRFFVDYVRAHRRVPGTRE